MFGRRKNAQEIDIIVHGDVSGGLNSMEAAQVS